MPDAVLLRPRLRVALLASLAGALLGLSCSGPRVPPCPSGTWCGTQEQAEAMRQTREQWLACPKYVAWGNGPDAPPPPAPGLVPHGEGSLELAPTREKRAAGVTDACCYHWFEPCPASKPAVDAGR